MILAETYREFYKLLNSQEKGKLKAFIAERVSSIDGKKRTLRTIQSWVNGRKIPEGLYGAVEAGFLNAINEKHRSLLEKQRELNARLDLVIREQLTLTQYINF